MARRSARAVRALDEAGVKMRDILTPAALEKLSLAAVSDAPGADLSGLELPGVAVLTEK